MTDTNPILSVLPRESTGRFAKGGTGRPKGAKSKIARAIQETMKSYGPEAMEKLLVAVRAGERWAIEYVLNKLFPAGRLIEFEAVTPEDVTEALAAGDITPDEAKDVSTTLAKLAEIGELAEIKDKLAELEGVIHAKG